MEHSIWEFDANVRSWYTTDLQPMYLKLRGKRDESDDRVVATVVAGKEL